MKRKIEKNKSEYRNEKAAREKRLMAYSEEIQKSTLEMTAKLITELVEERHRQGITLQELYHLIGILPSNLTRLEKGTRIPTFVVLQKYAAALGKHIEIRLCDGAEETE